MSNRGGQLAAGVVIFVVVVAAWVYAKAHGIETGELISFAVPVVGALFLAGPIGAAASSAQQAAHQTNGVLGDRIEAAVSSALAKRDAARTRQAQGDVSEVQLVTPTAWSVGAPPSAPTDPIS